MAEPPDFTSNGGRSERASAPTTPTKVMKSQSMKHWLGVCLLMLACTDKGRQPAPAPAAPPEAHKLADVVDAEPPAPTDHYRVVKLGGADVAIVPKEMAKDFPIWLKDGAKIAEYFTPTLADVTRAEGVLEPFIASQPAQRDPDPLAKRYHGYKRDWVGFVAGGKGKLFASFFCDTFDHDWTRGPIFVKDGGDCFFTVTFDLATQQFDSFFANGKG